MFASGLRSCGCVACWVFLQLFFCSNAKRLFRKKNLSAERRKWKYRCTIAPSTWSKTVICAKWIQHVYVLSATKLVLWFYLYLLYMCNPIHSRRKISWFCVLLHNCFCSCNFLVCCAYLYANISCLLRVCSRYAQSPCAPIDLFNYKFYYHTVSPIVWFNHIVPNSLHPSGPFSWKHSNTISYRSEFFVKFCNS